MNNTFFGAKIIPNNYYKAHTRHDLVLTRAILDPEASEDTHSRLFLQIEKTDGPIADLYGSQNISLPLNIHVSAGFQITFRVAGDAPVYVSGYFEPDRQMSRYRKVEDDSSSNHYYYSDSENNSDEEEDSNDNEESNQESENVDPDEVGSSDDPNKIPKGSDPLNPANETLVTECKYTENIPEKALQKIMKGGFYTEGKTAYVLLDKVDSMSISSAVLSEGIKVVHAVYIKPDIRLLNFIAHLCQIDVKLKYSTIVQA